MNQRRYTFAITGGIGTGKSTVTALFAQCGAFTFDADQLAREVVAPGSPALAQLAQRFGAQIITPSGTLDRPALARVVFADTPAAAIAKRDLEAITHPLIQQRFRHLRTQLRADAIVCYEIPLLAEVGRRTDVDFVVVVEAGEQVRLERLQQRGLSLSQAQQRIASQASAQQRRALADGVIDNSGTLEHTQAQVHQMWARISEQAQQTGARS